MAVTPVYLEIGKKSVFAVSLDWPGWCRRARTSALAIDELANYRPRYREILGDVFDPGAIEVIGSVPGNATTDFGAPGAIGPWDDQPLTSSELDRQVDVLRRCWEYFDEVVRTAPPELSKGPRGGGRDRGAIEDHVREAERVYGSKIGSRIAPRTSWDEQRAMLVAGLAANDVTAQWPRGYAIRRMAWHVTDHAWEISDKAG